MSTLESARSEMLSKAHSKHGAHCPCCERFIKLYRRPLSASMARYLIVLAKKSGTGNPWLHVETDFRDVSIPSRGDYAKLRYWGLIEPKPGVSERRATDERLLADYRQRPGFRGRQHLGSVARLSAE